MNFDHLPLFTITKSASEEWGDWVKKTALLVDRKYYTMHRIFEKEKWTLEEIRRAYTNATKHNGSCEPARAWWGARKRRNATRT